MKRGCGDQGGNHCTRQKAKKLQGSGYCTRNAAAQELERRAQACAMHSSASPSSLLRGVTPMPGKAWGGDLGTRRGSGTLPRNVREKSLGELIMWWRRGQSGGSGMGECVREAVRRVLGSR